MFPRILFLVWFQVRFGYKKIYAGLERQRRSGSYYAWKVSAGDQQQVQLAHVVADDDQQRLELRQLQFSPDILSFPETCARHTYTLQGKCASFVYRLPCGSGLDATSCRHFPVCLLGSYLFFQIPIGICFFPFHAQVFIFCGCPAYIP